MTAEDSTSSEIYSDSIVFDIEANGFLTQVTKVHCLCMCDPKTGERWSYGPEEITQGLEVLGNAQVIIGHNIKSYDLKVLAKVHGFHVKPGTRIIDTLVFSRLKHNDIKAEDGKVVGFPGDLFGRHSLAAWGHRLGLNKGDYKGPWDTWSKEMQDYCELDVEVSTRLLMYLRPWEYPRIPFELEDRVAEIVQDIELAGWPFNEQGAQALYCELVGKRDAIERSLVSKFGSWTEVDKVIIPKRDNKTRGYLKGVPVTKYKTVTFNPGSRVHIERKLRELGWVPISFTDTGRAKLDEEQLETIDLPEARELVDYLLIQKRLGQLGDGDNGWLKLVRGGIIHGSYNPCGTNTARCTHFSPNISQVPANKALYGPECRSLFGAPLGWKLVGADMAGLELRCLAHYLAYFDDGAYGKIVLDGDIHTFHQTMAGLETRDQAKTFIYAWLYGAGVVKIGTIVNGTAQDGARLKKNMLERIPALGKLMKSVKQGCAKGYLKGIDGRHLSIRSEHSALNLLLQNAGAVLCKQWLVDFVSLLKDLKYGWDGHWVIVGWIHDELQVACRENYEDYIGECLVKAAQGAGDSFGFKVRLDSKYKVGATWSDTH